MVQLRRRFFVSRTKNLKAVAELPARIFVKDYGKDASKCANRGLRGVAFSLGNDPNPILPGTRGTVNVVDDIATVHCTFDNGRTLGIAYGEEGSAPSTAPPFEKGGRKLSLTGLCIELTQFYAFLTKR